MVPLRPVPPSPKTSQYLLSFRSRTAGQARRRAGRGWGRGVGEGCGGISGRCHWWDAPPVARSRRPSARPGGAEAGSAGVQILRPPGSPPWVRAVRRAAWNYLAGDCSATSCPSAPAQGASRPGAGAGRGGAPPSPSPHRIPLTSGPRDPALPWEQPRLTCWGRGTDPHLCAAGLFGSSQYD